ADASKELKGSPAIMASGMNIFGRSFQNLIPRLKDGSQGLRDAGIEAEQLGLVLSTEAGQQAEEFNDNITRLQSALTGMWREVARQVRSEEHTSELQSRENLVCRLLLEKKKPEK